MLTNQYILSEHALIQLRRRKLDIEFIENTLEFPDTIFQDDPEITVYQKVRYEDNKFYLYRVFVNVNKRPMVIVTVYKTSKIDKYEDKV
jgi:hypothetical protein